MDIINEEKIKEVVIKAISDYLSEDYLRGFIAKVVKAALEEKKSDWDKDTIAEAELKKSVRNIAIEVLNEELNKRKDAFREAVRKILEEKGIDVIIERIQKVSVQKIAEAIQLEAWIDM